MHPGDGPCSQGAAYSLFAGLCWPWETSPVGNAAGAASPPVARSLAPVLVAFHSAAGMLILEFTGQAALLRSTIPWPPSPLCPAWQVSSLPAIPASNS